MSKIILAKSAGFCFGVSRSVKIAERELKSGKCFSLGPLIHNESVVRNLENQGLLVINSSEEAVPGSRVIIRAHGVSESEIESIKNKGAEVIDATCPYVKKIHEIVEEASKLGKHVIIIGEKEHPEVNGIYGRCNSAAVLANSRELESYINSKKELTEEAIIVVFQTTQTRQNLLECKQVLKKLCTNAQVFDTICFATLERQMQAKKLSGVCDAMVVIGAKHSANSRHLFRLCSANCANTQFVEDASELCFDALAKVSIIGITAGASTPQCIIWEVLNKMSDEINVSEIITEESPALETAAEAANETATENAAEVMAEAEEILTPENQKSDAEKTFDELLEGSLKTIYNGEVVSGTVVAISAKDVSVDLGTKYSAFIPADELTNDGELELESVVSLGDKIEAIVVRVNDVEGTAQLSKKRLDAAKSWNDIEQAHADGTVVSGVVKEENKGGVVVSVNGIRVFVPASRTGVPKNSPLSDIIKKPVNLKIIEMNRGRGRVIGSIRDAERAERRARSEAVWNEIEVGKEYKGVVKSLTHYGAFVDIGGVDGMVHVSELSWNRIKNPAEVVNIGDEIEVFVLDFDKEKHRISLGHKKQSDNPWNIFVSNNNVGDIINVKVVRIMPFGAFAEILPGVDGLIHISQIANRHISKPEDVLSIGDVLDVQITAIDTDKNRISLSARALITPAANEFNDNADISDAAEKAFVYELSETGEVSGIAPESSEEIQ